MFYNEQLVRWMSYPSAEPCTGGYNAFPSVDSCKHWREDTAPRAAQQQQGNVRAQEVCKTRYKIGGEIVIQDFPPRSPDSHVQRRVHKHETASYYKVFHFLLWIQAPLNERA